MTQIELVMKSKLLPNKKVTSLHKTEDGVVVKCTDGTLYEGTLIIGADSAYSAVRSHMATMDGQQDTQEQQ
ncbi:FAD/NAD(P)-binding domain-containing protein [Apiospora arundinis]